MSSFKSLSGSIKRVSQMREDAVVYLNDTLYTYLGKVLSFTPMLKNLDDVIDSGVSFPHPASSGREWGNRAV